MAFEIMMMNGYATKDLQLPVVIKLPSYEDMIDHRSYIHNLSSCEIEA